MNPEQLASALCVRLHAPEWEAPIPRQQPCTPCVDIAWDITKRDLADAAHGPCQPICRAGTERGIA